MCFTVALCLGFAGLLGFVWLGALFLTSVWRSMVWRSFFVVVWDKCSFGRWRCRVSCRSHSGKFLVLCRLVVGFVSPVFSPVLVLLARLHEECGCVGFVVLFF